jgi:DNA-binding CsgD family transcriptional regulator
MDIGSKKRFGKNHILLAILFFFYNFTYSTVMSYSNMRINEFMDENRAMFHNRLIMLTFGCSIIIAGLILSFIHISKTTLKRLMGIVSLLSAPAILFVYKTHNSHIFIFCMYLFTILIGFECVYYYVHLSVALDKLRFVGLIYIIGTSAAILSQYVMQFILSSNVCLYTLLVVAFLKAMTDWVLSNDTLSGELSDDKIESENKHSFLFFFISMIIVVILYEFIGNFLTFSLLEGLYHNNMAVYDSPRLFIIIPYIIMGIAMEIKDMKYISIISIILVLFGILNPILLKDVSSTYANACIYYIVAGTNNSFFVLMMLKLSRGQRFAPLIATSGRVVDSVFSFIFITPLFYTLPSYVIVGIELVCTIIIMIFAITGELNMSETKTDSVYHISPYDFVKKYNLTDKEAELFITAISFDGNMSELAKKLYISRSVLYRTLSNICDKTGCSSFQAVKQLYYDTPGSAPANAPTSPNESGDQISAPGTTSTPVTTPTTTTTTAPAPTMPEASTPTAPAVPASTPTIATTSTPATTTTTATISTPAPIPSFDDQVASWAGKYKLSDKETATLSLFLTNPGKTQKELAHMQNITLRTISRHIAGIKEKTGTNSLPEISALFYEER